jgi:hypothetical protein
MAQVTILQLNIIRNINETEYKKQMNLNTIKWSWEVLKNWAIKWRTDGTEELGDQMEN